MYKDIGKKIQLLAIVGFVVEAILSVILGIAFFMESEEPIWFLLILGGPLAAWAASWVLYGFGQLIINSDHSALDYNINKIALALDKDSDSISRPKSMNSFVSSPNVPHETAPQETPSNTSESKLEQGSESTRSPKNMTSFVPSPNAPQETVSQETPSNTNERKRDKSLDGSVLKVYQDLFEKGLIAEKDFEAKKRELSDK